MAVTLKDIAKKAKVTEQAVSMALRGNSRISAETKTKIRKIARELDYRPNLHARSLRRQSSKAIGFIFPDITYSYAQGIAEGARSRLDDAGYLGLIGLSSWNAQQEARELELMLGFQVEAFICTPIVGSDSNYAKVLDAGIPLVFVGNGLPLPGIEWVGLDSYDAGRTIMNHLVGLGHRRIAFMGTESMSNSLFLAPIRASYFDVLKQADIPVRDSMVCYSQVGDPGSVESLVDELIALDQPPTAICCVSDAIAYAVMNRLIQRGIDIPGDISVTGIGGLHSSGLEMISLTTVSEDAFQIGSLAAQTILELIKDPKQKLEHQVVRGDLIERKSTAPPPNSSN